MTTVPPKIPLINLRNVTISFRLSTSNREELSEAELSPESPLSIWRTDGAEIELQISHTENKENEPTVTVNSRSVDDDDASKAGGILGELTTNQLETLISASYKVSCEPCYAIPKEPPDEKKMLSEWDENISKRNAANAELRETYEESEKKSVKSGIKNDKANTTKENIFEDLSKDAFGRNMGDSLSKLKRAEPSLSRPKSRCPSVPEEPEEEKIAEIKKDIPPRAKNKREKQSMAVNTETSSYKNIHKQVALRKRESVSSSYRLFKYGMDQIGDDSSSRSIDRSSTTSTGYEIIVRPSGTFNINAGPVKIFKYGLDLRRIRGKLTEEIINRISMPTEASKIRSLREECLPACRRTLGGTVTRDFVCECCKRRHFN